MGRVGLPEPAGGAGAWEWLRRGSAVEPSGSQSSGASESLEDLLSTDRCPLPRHSRGFWCRSGVRVDISNKFPGDADAAGLATSSEIQRTSPEAPRLTSSIFTAHE